VVEQHGPVAQLAHLVQAVAHEDDGAALPLEPPDAVEALALERLVPDGEDLVDQEDLRVDVHGDGEGQPHVHAARVELDLGVDELRDAGEVDDLVEVGVGLLAREPEDRGVEVDVLPAGEVAVEPGPQLEQRGQPATALDVPGRRREDAADDLEQGALARAVVPDEPRGAAGAERQVDVPQRPELLGVLLRAPGVDQPLLERLVLAQGELLRDVVDPDDVGHRLRAPERSCPARGRRPAGRTRRRPGRRRSAHPGAGTGCRRSRRVAPAR
jgi:hypothetical protein